MEHAGIHRAPPPRTLGARRELPLGCSRGPGCPSSVGKQSSALLEQRHSWSPLQSPAPPTSTGGEGGNIENLSLSANKSMQVRLQGNLRRPLRPARPDGAGAAPTAPAAGKSSQSCFRGGRRPRGWKMNQQSVHFGFVWFSTNGIELAARTPPARLRFQGGGDETNWFWAPTGNKTLSLLNSAVPQEVESTCLGSVSLFPFI